MKHLFFSLLSLVYFCSICSAGVTIPEKITVRVNRLVRIEAKSETPVKWINLHEDLDLIPDTTGKYATMLAAKAGRYKIAAYTAAADGTLSDPAYCLVIAEGEQAPPIPPPPGPKPNPNAMQAIVKLRFGNSGCTATIIGPQRADGRWDVLTAAHCTGAQGSKGQMTLLDGRSFAVTVAARNTKGDVSWMIAETNESNLPYAMLASDDPPIGTPVWHKGYGIDRPGNLEEGTIASALDANGQIKMVLSVSSGDSGSGIFRTDTNEVVAVVCCTASMAKKGNMWGGSCSTAAKMRPPGRLDSPVWDDWMPVPIPLIDDEPRFMPFVES